MILLDTTILVYAVGADHPLREPCRWVVDTVAEGLNATTTPEVLQEFCHVRARRYGRRDAVKVTADYASLLGPLRPVTETDLIHGLAEFSGAKTLGMFGAVLAAAAKNSGAALISADKAFDAVTALQWLNPAGDNFQQLVLRYRNED